MSVFLNIFRLDEEGNTLPISRDYIESILKSSVDYRLVEEQGVFGIQMPGRRIVLLEGKCLSYRVDSESDLDSAQELLLELANLLPDAEVQDEEGNPLSWC